MTGAARHFCLSAETGAFAATGKPSMAPAAPQVSADGATHYEFRAKPVVVKATGDTPPVARDDTEKAKGPARRAHRARGPPKRTKTAKLGTCGLRNWVVGKTYRRKVSATSPQKKQGPPLAHYRGQSVIGCLIPRKYQASRSLRASRKRLPASPRWQPIDGPMGQTSNT